MEDGACNHIRAPPVNRRVDTAREGGKAAQIFRSRATFAVIVGIIIPP